VSNPTGKTPQGVVVGGIPKAWNRIEHHDTLVALYEKRIAEVAAAGFENVICFSGNRDGLADEKGLEHCALGLKRIMGVAEKHRVTVVMELLNSKVNHKDYMCDRTPWGVELAKRIGSERFKLLVAQCENAPRVTRERLYIEAVENVLGRSQKVVVDAKGSNQMLYLPLDKLIDQQRRSSEPEVAVTAPRAGAAVAEEAAADPRARVER
jgi:hypothetical protein